MPSSGDPKNKRNKGPMIFAACVAAVMLIVAVAIAVATTSNSIPTHEGVVATSNDAFYTATSKTDVAQDPQTGVSYADNEMIVYAAKGVTRQQVENLLAAYNVTLLGYNAASNSYQFRVPSAMTYAELMALCDEIKALEGIADAYTNPTFDVADSDDKQPVAGSQPVAPKPPHQPERVDSAQKNDPYLTWGLDAIKAKNAWNALGCDSADKKPGSSINVGILDDQFFADHKNLSGAFAEMSPSYSDGFSAWYNSKSYLSSDEWRNNADYDGEPAPDDDYNATHGTHVAGIIAGSQNDQGVSGIAHGVTLYGWQDGLGDANRGADGHLKQTASSKTCYSWASALDYLVGEHDCKVINISAGFANPGEVTDATRDSYASVLSAHMKALIRNGHEFVICVAAGNDKDVEALKSDRFSWINDPELRDRIIVVGAAARDDSGNISVADYSSGGDRVDVIAPGSKIMSTVYTVDEETHNAVDDYAYMWGTSMATPMVAGAAALAFKANPDLSGAQVKQAICNAEGAQTLKGVNGNKTPARPLLDVSRVVSTAQSMKGESGQLANKYNEEEEEAERKKQETPVTDASTDGNNEANASGNQDANGADQSKTDTNNKDANNKDANNKDANNKDNGNKDANNKDANGTDQNKTDANNKDANGTDQNKTDANNKDANNGEQNKKDSNTKDANTKDANTKDTNSTENKETNNKDANNKETNNKDANNTEQNKNDATNKDANNKGTNAATYTELGSTNVDVTSDGQYIYFCGAGDVSSSAFSVLPKVLRAPLTDVSKQETLWESNTSGLVSCCAVGDDKLVFGVKPDNSSTLEFYAMNKDGSGLQKLEPLCGETSATSVRIAIYNGRVYYPKCTGKSPTTCEIRSCTLAGTDDRLLCSQQFADAKGVSVFVQGVQSGVVCYSTCFYSSSGMSYSAYTVSPDANAGQPTEVATGYATNIVLAGQQFVSTAGNTLVSIPITGGSPKTLATLGADSNKTLFILGASPSHAFVSGSGTGGAETWYIDVKSGVATQLDTVGFGEGNFNIVGDSVYLTSYGTGSVTDLKLQGTTRVY